jgi:hypothetical protein
MRTIVLVLLTAASFVPIPADAAKPINNLRDQTVPSNVDGSSRSIKQVQSIVVEACLARGWQPVVEEKGLITASINVRGRHYAKISIPFTSNAYSILYVESNNLDYNAKRQRIHRNYNNWVIKLSGTIDKYFRAASQGTGPAPVLKQEATDLYTQLSKLGELRERGILTDKEFEAEKARLLKND